LFENIFKATTKMFEGHGLGKNPIISKLYQRIGKKIVGEFFLFEGQKIFCGEKNLLYSILAVCEHESFELSLFKQKIGPGDIVIDIGANVGVYTLLAAKLVGTLGKVFSFEPDQIAFLNLKKNVDYNHHNNVILIDKAVSSKTGSALFSVSNELATDNHLVKDTNSFQKNVQVKTISLDEFCERKSIKPKIIKIDIEGGEFEALKGMKNLCENNSELILFLEFNPKIMYREGTNIPQFLDYLFGFNFEVYNINEKKKTKELVDKTQLLKFAKDHNTKGLTNLICTKKID